MFRKFILQAMLVLATGLFPQIATAQQQQRASDAAWTTLGRYVITADAKSWRLAVANADRYNATRLVVVSGTLSLERVVVAYRNGQIHYEDRVVTLAPSQRLSPIDERDEQNAIDYFDLVIAKDRAPRGNVVVEIGGIKHAPPPAVPVAGGAKKSAKSAPKKNGFSIANPPSPPTSPTVATRGFSAPMPTKEATAPAGGSPASASTNLPYAVVPVFFGTDRKREPDRSKWGRPLATFSGNADSKATLGRAVISVPKQGREKGEIRRPEWDLFFTSVSLRAEDLTRDFVLLNVDVLDKNALLGEVRAHAKTAVNFKDQAFVFVHGYRVSFDDALFRAAQIAHDMGFDGLPFVYSWPSSAGVAGYLYDERRAVGAREHLREFLDMVVKESGAKKVHLIAHSMGAQALLEVLRDIRNIGGPGIAAKPVFNEVILAAPDVTRENFEQITRLVRGLSTGMTLYASANDRALRLSQKLSGASAGHVPAAGPLVVGGVDSIDVSAASTDFFSLNHSTFADRAQLLEDMRRLLDKGQRPPDQRIGVYTPVTGTTGKYWKYEKKE